MEIERMREILKLMRENNVAGFEVGDFKVSFFANTGEMPRLDDDGNPIPRDQQIDDDLGLDYGEV